MSNATQVHETVRYEALTHGRATEHSIDEQAVPLHPDAGSVLISDVSESESEDENDNKAGQDIGTYRHSLDKSQQKPAQGVTDDEPAKDATHPSTLWQPFWLRRTVLAVFGGLFLAFMLTLSILLQYSERHDGIKETRFNMVYLWRFGPTGSTFMDPLAILLLGCSTDKTLDI